MRTVCAPSGNALQAFGYQTFWNSDFSVFAAHPRFGLGFDQGLGGEKTIHTVYSTIRPEEKNTYFERSPPAQKHEEETKITKPLKNYHVVH